MKRYIVTEEEIRKLISIEHEISQHYEFGFSSLAEKAEAKLEAAWETCLSRAVPEWASHFAGDLVAGCEFAQAEEIK